MALLSDERTQRLLDTTGSRVATEERAARMTDGRSVPSESDVHYNDKYGTTLSDSQVTAIDKNQQEFKTSVDGANAEISKYSTNLEEGYSKDKEKLTKIIQDLPIKYSDWSTKNKEEVTNSIDPVLYTDPETGPYEDTEEKARLVEEKLRADYKTNLMSNPTFSAFYDKWSEENTLPVTVTDGYSFSKVYRVDKETANSKIANLDFKGYGSVSGNSTTGYYVGSDTYASDLKVQLDAYDNNLLSSIADTYIDKTGTSSNESLSEIESQYTLGKDTLAYRQKEIAAYEDQNLAALGTIRTKYANKLKNISDTIGSSTYGY